MLINNIKLIQKTLAAADFTQPSPGFLSPPALKPWIFHMLCKYINNCTARTHLNAYIYIYMIHNDPKFSPGERAFNLSHQTDVKPDAS